MKVIKRNKIYYKIKFNNISKSSFNLKKGFIVNNNNIYKYKKFFNFINNKKLYFLIRKNFLKYKFLLFIKLKKNFLKYNFIKKFLKLFKVKKLKKSFKILKKKNKYIKFKIERRLNFYRKNKEI